MRLRACLSCVPLTLIAAVAVAAEQDRARAELNALAAQVKGFRIVDLAEREGTVKLSTHQSLTVEELRGIMLDENPPELGERGKPYDPRMTDSFAPGEAPYVARGIAAFRFRYFTNEFSYGGWHNWAMHEYAVTHGFNVLYPYNHKPADWRHVPKGTKWLRWGGFINWEKWLHKHGIPALRYDKLTEMDVTQTITDERTFKPNDERYDQLMIDLEHRRLSPQALRKQPWYPHNKPEAERQAFEKRHYDGYALTYTAPVAAARRAGWRSISLYGWQPFARMYWGLEKVRLDPATDSAWNAFGKQIYDVVDILNPSVYCFYWSPKNVAYTLANIDLNMQLVNTMPKRKPVRPYYWTLLHGGGGGTRWWKGQPVPDEDVRAMTAFCFFTGCDGLVLWNWSGTGSHHVHALKAGGCVMVRERFSVGGKEGEERAAFERYDVLQVQNSGRGTVKFQRVEKGNPRGKYGLTPDKPVYEMPRDELLPRLRAQSAPVAAMVEGLALVKPFEYILRHGEVKVDMSAQEQFAKTLPIVRRVKLGPYHVIATYDPLCLSGGPARKITLEDFDGQRGLTLTLPADRQTRIHVVRTDAE